MGVAVGGISVGAGVFDGVAVVVGVGDAGISVACLVSSVSIGSVLTTMSCSDPHPDRISNILIVIIICERFCLGMDKLYNIIVKKIFGNFSLIFKVKSFHGHLARSYFRLIFLILFFNSAVKSALVNLQRQFP